VSHGSHTIEAHSIEIALIVRGVIDPAETADEGLADEIPRGQGLCMLADGRARPRVTQLSFVRLLLGGNPTIGILEWWYDTYAQAILCS
jgi:hypothetical protein